MSAAVECASPIAVPSVGSVSNSASWQPAEALPRAYFPTEPVVPLAVFAVSVGSVMPAPSAPVP